MYSQSNELVEFGKFQSKKRHIVEETN